ncbi:uncharacterized protein IL334_004525 [Kwoniella shivajii]|uniref:Phospholipase n=1 Tax=Kwoniella shivajii TaxID=564305 RepID=A0ABZ1D0K2_9TREE|nr:hypothetical protein IL334_004525 [Kwoniella shivajii]
MSGPAGSGANKTGNFSGIVSNLVKKKKTEDDRDSALSIDGTTPSKGLPSTGLKRNTKEWKEAQHSRKNRSDSSASSSSSIPDDATGNEDGRTEEERIKGQEGPEGKGPGNHERFISNGHAITDSPESSPTTENPPSVSQQNGAHKKVDSLTINRDKYDIDPEEKAERRDSEKARKRTDELGRRPDAMDAVKEEEGPGPRNEIVLDPRISHMHYHQRREPTVEGLKLGPILQVTADGEGEYPPGETPLPSRQHSSSSRPISHASNDIESYERGIGDTLEEGTWRSAMSESRSQSHGRRKPNARFSSFRESAYIDSEENEGGSDSNQDENSPTNENAQKRWSMLRNRVLPSKSTTSGSIGPGKVSALAPTVIASLPVTTELFAGQLPVMIMKTWLDRDEDGHKAVPVLLGNLRFRVGDSVGLRPGGETGKEMFKLECEYGDGAVKWLRDFLSLHAHYKAANFGTSVAGLRASRRVEIPDFPKMSIPYLNKVRGQGKGGDKEKQKPVGKAEYAQASRDALQRYLVDLIRAVIFRPESNRLCKFFELSALTLQLAPRGGFQGKAGFLKIPGWDASRRANQPGLAPTTWAAHRKPKWFIVRDSYFVATDGPESTDFYDVFLIDSDFSIERPKRYYRTGIHLLSSHGPAKQLRDKGDLIANAEGDNPNDIDLDNPFNRELIISSGEGKGSKGQSMHDEGEHHASQHTFTISNSQRRMKLVAKNARQMHQFIVSMERIAAQCIWTGRNRFDSFAPLRVNVAAQWLVDGRDYFWNLSRAINMAKDRIYIHDWWISPELYLRRPGDERYRLDNLLKRKAEDGVKIFIIIYNEVSDKTTPVDSLYTKKTLTGLHPNVMVQRSPSHFQTGTFYWSHVSYPQEGEELTSQHEKLCVIDETIAFMGGLDLAPDGPDGPVWRGKDYSNERVMEYSNLNKPFEDMFDRTRVPRMPWHDVGLQIVGQPARDLCRHFVQRWNLLIRTKNHKRQMPFLLPAADFTERELQDLKLQGTCEVQICRSVGPWSMGTLTKIEHSIQNAYVKCYTYPIDSGEASSVRLILECQNRTISRGTNSIFSRLRKEGIDTMIVDDRLVLCGSANINERSQRGDRDSELLAVVRDTDMIDGTMAGRPFKVGRFAHTLRIRLMREHVGVDVDSIDEDQLMSREPVAEADEVETWDPDHEQDSDDDQRSGITKIKARPARDRLMQTVHSGLSSVTKGMSENAISNVRRAADKVIHPIAAAVGGQTIAHHIVEDGDPSERQDFDPSQGEQTAGFASSIVPTLEEKTIFERRPSGTHANGKPLFDVLEESEGGEGGEGQDVEEEAKVPERAKKDNLIAEDSPSAKKAGAPRIQSKPGEEEFYGAPANAHMSDSKLPTRDTGRSGDKEEPLAIKARKTLRKHLHAKVQVSPWNMPTPTPKINPDRFHDPLDERFWKDMWVAVAVHNTEIFRKVFRCIPDDLVTSWAQYKSFANHAEKFNKSPADVAAPGHDEPIKVTHEGPGTHGSGGGGSGGGQVGGGDGGGAVPGKGADTRGSDVVNGKPNDRHKPDGRSHPDEPASPSATRTSVLDSHEQQSMGGGEKKPSAPDEAWSEWERDQMEELLGEIRGHLVIYPTRFMEAEDLANNFLFNSDKILPLPIYD